MKEFRTLPPLAIVFFSLTFICKAELSLNYFTRRYEMENKIYTHGLLQEVSVLRRLHCVAACDQNETCDVVLYNPNTHQCRLYDHNPEEDGMLDQTGWQCWGVVSCGNPITVSNGKKSYTTVTYKSTTTYTCNKGYHFRSIGPQYDVTCQANGKWTSLPGECTNIKDCMDILEADSFAVDGVYAIKPNGYWGTFNVYCDMTNNGGGWTVIQRRQDGSEDFYMFWYGFKMGIGKLKKEFWLGNLYIYYITKQRNYEIRFDLEDWSGDKRYAVYSQFRIQAENKNFRLVVSGYTGDAGDSFAAYHNGMDFSARDGHDNDLSTKHCAEESRGGWWYKDCHESNLNGRYNQTSYGRGINWFHFRGLAYSLKSTTMKIRPT